MSEGSVKFQELFQSRNEHETRISVMEANVRQFMDNSEKTNLMVENFIRTVNGVPMNNAKEISQIKTERCAPMAIKVDWLRKMSWMILGMGFLLSVLIGGGFLGLILGWFKIGA